MMNDDITMISDGSGAVVIRRPGSDLVTEIPRVLFRPLRHQRHGRIEDSPVPCQYAHCFLSIRQMAEEPRIGDELKEKSGRRWTIVEVHRSELNETWQCVVQTFSVTFGLDEFVDLMRAAYTKSSAGVLQPGYRAIKTGIGAKFSRSVLKFESEYRESLFVLLKEMIDAVPKDVLRRNDGSMYEIKQVKKPRFPADWTEIEVVQVLQ